MLRMYAKTENMIDLLYEFTTRQWIFDNGNTRELWSSLSKNDREMFRFSLEEFDWKPYIKSYYYGTRRHVLHEDLSNVEKASSKNQMYDIVNCDFRFSSLWILNYSSYDITY